MPIDEQIIKLALDLGASPEEAAKLSAALDRINAAGAKAAADGLDSLEKSTAKATRSMAGIGPAALQGGRALQDFSQGGIGGILNNIEGLAFALGGGPGLAGLLTAVGLAAYFAIPAIKQFASSLSGAGANEIPKTGDALKDVTRDLEETSKRMDKLRDSGRLNNAELAEFNRLSQEEIRLTREKEAIKKERDIAEKAAALKPAGEAEQAKQVAEALQGSFGDAKSRQDLIARVLAGLPTDALDRAKKESSAANRALQDSLTRDPLNLVGMQDALQQAADAAMARVRAESARMRSEAESVVNRAIVEGDLGAFGRLRGEIGARPGAFTAAQRAAIEQASPEAFAADDAFERQLGERKQAVKERDEQVKEAQKKADAKAKADADDIEAGREMDLAGREGYARMQAKLAKEIEDALKAEDDMNERLGRLWAKQDKAKADAAGDVIRQATGGSLGADLTREAAEMSVQLQRQGLDANEATQQAIGAALQAMREMAMDASMQRRQAGMMVQQIEMLRRAQRAEVQAQHQPFQPRTR